MKRTQFRMETYNLSDPRYRRMFVIFMMSTAGLFLVLGVFFVFQTESNHNSQLGKVTSNITSRTLLQVMSDNVPYLQEMIHRPGSEQMVSRLFFEVMTSFDPQDPRTFLSNEIPLFALFDTDIDTASKDVTFSDVPIESSPPANLEEQVMNQIKKQEQTENKPPSTTVTSPKVKRVFIYHSHFSESYIPELDQSKGMKANDANKNITLVGKHLAEDLAKMGIGSVASHVPYPYQGAYNASRKTVVQALKEYDHLMYLIDIHRDSQRRKKTTITIKGKTYARLAFVVGGASKHYTDNLKLARSMYKDINKIAPGLVRGVFIKPRTMGTNGEYNQSLSKGCILVEIGGIDNNFQEVYRSTDILAKVLRERISDAIPVQK
ncbi:stage II sporulation protein P [Shimazuella sp. AN120528]|uniref:stage II sporulation protein P n=1 Tax=Shimazuella soli TaxID=1892854 RepID=UPI001F108BFA|nr:stage II sporulation protein P [Shimazuella soli]MCH5583839.1 stage II sporulation protein P [Shimazuella soli]